MIDVAPTVLAAAGLPQPKTVNGVVQKPIEGVSMMNSFDDAQAKSAHTTQYYEIYGNRGIYKDGWYAATLHKVSWEPKPRTARTPTTNGSCATWRKTSAVRPTCRRSIPTS